MKRQWIATIALAGLVLTACGGNEGNSRGVSEDEQGAYFTNDAPTDNYHPRTMRNVGDTWGLKQDRELIRSAAESVPGVEVQRVIIDSTTARVTANIEQENLSDADKQEWIAQIKQAIERAMPRYDIRVRVR
ncbi:hypothetical protein [Thalassobacillus pellis]|uniref:hypothetical protein n=1 Tax=Thalassobacillus pellis TaxID=748008 RepID=UPI0019609DD8|nr:hypothetical protein [Thalassobacillus pellis]MBM7551781.1 uncharacterized protein YcfL [Thalassobacillus pellis]